MKLVSRSLKQIKYYSERIVDNNVDTFTFQIMKKKVIVVKVILGDHYGFQGQRALDLNND